MNPLRTFYFAACLAAVAYAYPNQKSNARSNSVSNQLKPTQWLSPAELESLPAVQDITVQQLENMPTQEGAQLIEKMYHLSQINQDLAPSYVPSSENIQAYIIKPNGQNVSVNLNQLTSAAKQQPNFGDEEVTVFLTGYPQTTSTIRKATRKLVQAYMQRYNAELQQKKTHQYAQQHGQQQHGQRNQQQQQQQQHNQQQNQQQQQQKRGNNNNNNDYNYYDDSTSSEENQNQWKPSQQTPTGDLIVIDLGSAYKNFGNIATLNTEKTGAMIAHALLEMCEELNVPEEIIHMVGQGPSAHVAGAAGRHFKRHNGRPVRRITGLDPSKQFAKRQNTLTGLARGDADFVDVIHTTAYGMGTPQRLGDVDFYPNGPSVAVPGSESIVEGTMRATRYFAESVRPGNEHNFPAVAANSLTQYRNNNGHGRRAYMGIATDYDLEGDYILQVNPHSPFGKSTPAQTQNTYHSTNQAWKNRNNQDDE